MINVVNFLTGYNEAIRLQNLAEGSTPVYKYIDKDQTSNNDGKLEIAYYDDDSFQKLQNAWRSVAFRSKVGLVVLGLTGTVVFVGGIGSIQNKSSNATLAVICTCFIVNMQLLLATFGAWKNTNAKVAINKVVREVLKDGLKARENNSGSTALANDSEPVNILCNLKTAYKNVRNCQHLDSTHLETFGEFLLLRSTREFTLLTLPLAHPARLAIQGMYKSYDEVQISIENSKKYFEHNLSFISEIENDDKHNQNLSHLKSFNFPSLNQTTVRAYKLLALEKVYDTIIEKLQEGAQLEDWNRFCYHEYVTWYVPMVFKQSFKDLCAAGGNGFADWLREQIDKLPDGVPGSSKPLLKYCFSLRDQL